MIHPVNDVENFSYFSLANLLSYTNLTSGLLSCFYSIENKPIVASYLLILAFICDLFDGITARKLNQSSSFGKQLDSFSDLTSFIIAPIIFFYCLEYTKNYHYLVFCFYALMGVVRLSKFNLGLNIKSNKTYIGIPVPFSLFIVLGWVFSFQKNLSIYHELWMGFMVFHGFFMVSKVQVPKIWG